MSDTTVLILIIVFWLFMGIGAFYGVQALCDYWLRKYRREAEAKYGRVCNG